LPESTKRNLFGGGGMVLAEDLSRYFLSVEFGDLDGKTVSEAKRRVIDALGCAIGAFRERPIEIARSVASLVSSKEPATLLGTRRKTSPDMAAFVNGFMVRYFDFNDTYLSKEPAHPSDNLGACLPVAEAEGKGGKDLLLSLILAYEIQCRLCDAADIRHRGWDHVNYGLVSTALASGRLMGLDVKRSTQAVNIALNGHIAMRQVRAGELSMWKGASFSNAARNGVFAASLAREGMTGPSPIFEGEMGFFRQVSGPFTLDVESFGGRKGSFKINETYIKYWPAEYHSQTAVWAALELRRKVGDVGRIQSVLIESHEAGYTILGKDPEKWRPETKETADHSLPYIVSMALLEGKIDNSTYSPRKFRDSRVLDFVSRVEVKEDRRLTELYPQNGIANRITVRLKDGSTLTEEVIVPKGHPKNPMTDEEVEAKFLRLTKRFLGEEGSRRALRLLWSLEDVKDVSDIVSALVV
jgi:2-methylcitrate dehydratase